ncbi:hypothetical protein [Aquibium sp. ELW1220]|uniref:hypothetical protein n=1 Tax=Aquibium sp. ELW1220 TaxID=2976766 RepID=UPI0025AF446D|nr:hypothetical protein [Aquibium sp. ELW1220]MDN2584067.1 hypothetical protein [Aquibium sp. ELW1220]
MPTVATLTHAVARHSGIPASRVRSVSRRLQDAGLLPISMNRNAPEQIDMPEVVALVVALLTDAPLHSVAARADEFLAFRLDDDDGRLIADELLAKMFTRLANLQMAPMDDLAKMTMRSAISVVSGSRPALVIRAGNSESDPVEWALTADGTAWRPELAAACQKSMSLGGYALLKIISDLGLGMERRTVPFRVASVDGRPLADWKAGVEAELAKMEAA